MADVPATRTYRETESHLGLKAMALQWAREQGMTLGAPEVAFPHRRFRVDVAACAPDRKVPSRKPELYLRSVLKAAAVFECKQARSDLIRDNKRHAPTLTRLKTLLDRRAKLEALLHLHLPHLRNGETLFPEFDSYRLREHRHEGYEKLTRQIALAQKAIKAGVKFDRLLSYRLANLHYLVIEENLMAQEEVPIGWGLLVRMGERLELVAKPTWQEIGVEHQLVFLQRIAACKSASQPKRRPDVSAGSSR